MIALLSIFPLTALNQSATAGDIGHRLAEDPEFAIFATALEKSGLSDWIRQSGPFTVFVPSDSAMRNEGSAFLLENVLLTNSNKERLSWVISNHIIAGAQLRADAIDGSVELVTAADEPLLIERYGSALHVGPIAVVTRKIGAENGVIFVVDRLLWPEYRPPLELVVTLGTPNNELRVSPGNFTFVEGQPVRLVIRNPSLTSHYFWAPEFGGYASRSDDVSVENGDAKIRLAGAPEEGYGTLEIRIDPGGTAVWDFVPQLPGSYRWGCSMPAHADAGMAGIIEVSPKATRG